MKKTFETSDNSVMIKGNKYGLIIHIDEELDYDNAKDLVLVKLKECEKFYKGAALAVTFEGKRLSDEQEREIITLISQNSELHITCIIDNDKFKEDYFKKKLDDKVRELEATSGQFYKGTLRSGQVLESDSSVVILGDVNPGAKVVAAGNVVVLGTLKGTVYAGVSGNMSSFVVALDMRPVQVRIGDIIGRSPDNPSKGKQVAVPMIAYVENENIYIEPLNKEVLNDIKGY